MKTYYLKNLELFDLYAIKHSIQATLRYKEIKLNSTNDKEYKELLEKDIVREVKLLERVTGLIEIVK